jgi:hypothetical protein
MAEECVCHLGHPPCSYCCPYISDELHDLMGYIAKVTGYDGWEVKGEEYPTLRLANNFYIELNYDDAIIEIVVDGDDFYPSTTFSEFELVNPQSLIRFEQEFAHYSVLKVQKVLTAPSL